MHRHVLGIIINFAKFVLVGEENIPQIILRNAADLTVLGPIKIRVRCSYVDCNSLPRKFVGIKVFLNFLQIIISYKKPENYDKYFKDKLQKYISNTFKNWRNLLQMLSFSTKA